MKIKKSVKGGAKSKKGKQKDPLALEMEKMKEEENQRRREEHLKTRLQELQAEEALLSKMNSYKIMNHWRNILRKAKTEELRKEIEILAQSHERQVDRKDAVIQMLYRDLEEAEEQYRLALRSHLQNVDELLDLQKKTVESLEAEFEADLAMLQKEFELERHDIQVRHSEEKEEMLDIINAMNAAAEELQNEMLQEFSNNYEEIKNHTSEQFNIMRVTMEEKIKMYQAMITEENKKHLESMEGSYKEYNLYKQQDQKTSENILLQDLKITRLTDSLAQWKAKLLNNIRECEERNKALRDEKNTLAKHFKDLKKQMNRFRESEQKRLNELVKMSRECIKSMEEKLARGERILKLAELNRKLETEQEKILPFGFPPPGTNEQDQPMDPEKLGQLDDEQSEILSQFEQKGLTSEWEQLHNFYRRYNKALLDRTALIEERNQLNEENARLRALLKQYLDGISVNEDVLNQVNPLMVVDSMKAHYRGGTSTFKSMNAAGGNLMTNAVVPVIEAAHVIQYQQIRN